MMAGVTTVASATVSTDRWLIMIETIGGGGIQHSIRGQGEARRTNGGDRWRTSGKHLWSGRMRGARRPGLDPGAGARWGRRLAKVAEQGDAYIPAGPASRTSF